MKTKAELAEEWELKREQARSYQIVTYLEGEERVAGDTVSETAMNDMALEIDRVTRLLSGDSAPATDRLAGALRQRLYNLLCNMRDRGHINRELAENIEPYAFFMGSCAELGFKKAGSPLGSITHIPDHGEVPLCPEFWRQGK